MGIVDDSESLAVTTMMERGNLASLWVGTAADRMTEVSTAGRGSTFTSSLRSP